MSRYLWWQPISFLFVHHTGYQGINLGLLTLLLFNMYILWAIGSDVHHRVGKKSFLRFYFITGIVAGLLSFLFMLITRQFGIVSGATPSILGILVVWTLINPEEELLLFFLIPVKAKWLTTGIIGALLLTTLSSLNLVSFSLCFFGALIGYLYALIAWDLHSPFFVMYRFELAVIRHSEKIRRAFFRLLSLIKPLEKTGRKSNIFDIKTGKSVLDDDDFVDAMLRKMARHGQDSLTWQEKQRMREITEKKSQEKHRL
jgi:membrane associated rhomboid family serine protease